MHPHYDKPAAALPCTALGGAHGGCALLAVSDHVLLLQEQGLLLLARLRLACAAQRRLLVRCPGSQAEQQRNRAPCICTEGDIGSGAASTNGAGFTNLSRVSKAALEALKDCKFCSTRCCDTDMQLAKTPVLTICGAGGCRTSEQRGCISSILHVHPLGNPGYAGSLPVLLVYTNKQSVGMCASGQQHELACLPRRAGRNGISICITVRTGSTAEDLRKP